MNKENTSQIVGEEGEVILDVTLENHLSFFWCIRTLHTVPDHAFIENGVKSNIFTHKMVAYKKIRHFVSKSTAVMCTPARDSSLDHEYL